MRTAMDFAIKRARHGHGGMVIEAVTYRLSDHTTADDARRYRPDDEVKAAWQREPLKRMKAYLMSLNAWTEEEEEAWKAECAAKVDAEVNAYLETKSQPIEARCSTTPGRNSPTSPRSAPRRSGRMSENTSDAWAYHDLLFPDRCDGECDGERSRRDKELSKLLSDGRCLQLIDGQVFIDGQKQKVGLVTGPADMKHATLPAAPPAPNASPPFMTARR
jgi:hypothetical protein